MLFYNHGRMPADDSNSPQSPRPSSGKRAIGAINRLRDYWQRITEGVEVERLWSQFVSEARQSYSLYSRDVDWSTIPQRRGLKRAFRGAWALFQAMLMKLSPSRRVLLLIAAALFVYPIPASILGGRSHADFAIFFEISGLLIFLLLALELADRITMKRDLEIAREIQSWLVPREAPQIAGIDIAFATRPANTVAGDYYDAFLRPAPSGSDAPDRLILVVADVAGKSVPAALLMASFQAGLRTLAATPGTLDALVAALDRYACAHSLDGLRFTTAFIAEVEPGGRSLRYINAGHNAPILQHASGRRERLEIGGIPLGIGVDGAPGHYDSGAASIDTGDVLVIFTDGLVEAENSAEEEYSEARVFAQLNSSANLSSAEILKNLLADVDGFVGATRQHDDITCLIARFQ
ncbi:MAG: PP2C family protein-serine/threonine phosphatase [Candidatus Acidiferrales bacterium]